MNKLRTILAVSFLCAIALYSQADIVGRVGAEVVAPVRQLADSQLVLADVIQDHRLDVVHVLDVLPLKLPLHYFKKLSMKPFDQVDGFQILFYHRWPTIFLFVQDVQ